MDTNQVFLTRMMLNIATPSDQELSFSRGEILHGTVQEVGDDGLVMILLKGRLTEATTEVMVKPGQQLFLLVDDIRDGKTYLKVLGPEGMEKVENANLSANLQNMGIPAREDTVLISRKLLQYNLPVTAHNFNEMLKGINILGGATPENLEITAFALSHQLPLNQSVLSSLVQFTTSDSDLSSLLQNLIKTMSLLPTEGEKGVINQLARPLAELLQVEMSDNPMFIKDKIPGILQSEKEIIKGLILLQDLLKKGETGAKIPVLNEILKQMEGMEKELGGQRIFNFISRLPDSNFNYYYFSFPVKIKDEYRLCQLRINQDTGKKTLQEQDNIKFIVSLDTAKMGMVLFHVNYNSNQKLTLQGVVETEKVMYHLNQNVDKLIKGLSKLGYSVNNLGIRVVSPGEVLDKLRPEMKALPMKISPLSIDITV